MSAHYCPDCGLFEVSVRKPGKDGRCDWCRSQLKQSKSRRTFARDDADNQFRALLENHNNR